MSVRPLTLAAAMPTIGLFGKLPARRDFIRHGIDNATLALIEPWLHAGLHASRTALGDDWDAVYMGAPIWRFRCEDDRIGGSLRGVMMPSVDGVGRKFPLLVLSQFAVMDDRKTMPIVPSWGMLNASADRPWYDAAEDVALSALDEDVPLEDVLRRTARTAALAGGGGYAATTARPARLPSAHAARCLWWAAALEATVPPMAFPSTLPPTSVFASLLAGVFDRASVADLVEDGAA